MRLTEKLKTLDSALEKQVGAENCNTVRLTGAACTASFFLGTGKLLMGIFSASFFTIMNALYTYGMVAAKLIALKGIAVFPQKQYAFYRKAARILGLCMGGCAALLGCFMFWRAAKLKQQEEDT